MKNFLLTLCLIGILNNANAAPLNVELIVNGGAETGNTIGWESTGIDAVVPDDFAKGFGSFAFTGGTGFAGGQTLLQTIDLRANAAEIDSNKMNSIFSIQLQSRTFKHLSDPARADVFFLDDVGNEIDSFTLIDDINTDLFDWNLFSDTRLIPKGTRFTTISLEATRSSGSSSDGHFDNASLKIAPTPLPAAIWLFGSGIGGLFFRKILSKLRSLFFDK